MHLYWSFVKIDSVHRLQILNDILLCQPIRVCVCLYMAFSPFSLGFHISAANLKSLNNMPYRAHAHSFCCTHGCFNIQINDKLEHIFLHLSYMFTHSMGSIWTKEKEKKKNKMWRQMRRYMNKIVFYWDCRMAFLVQTIDSNWKLVYEYSNHILPIGTEIHTIYIGIQCHPTSSANLDRTTVNQILYSLFSDRKTKVTSVS